ncbi:hypothetical protein ABK040_011381 [Willaertia magna]
MSNGLVFSPGAGELPAPIVFPTVVRNIDQEERKNEENEEEDNNHDEGDENGIDNNNHVAVTIPHEFSQPLQDSSSNLESSEQPIPSNRYPPVLLHWENIEYIVKTKERTKLSENAGILKKIATKFTPNRKKDKQIIYKCSGYIEPGHILALMGPSGSGKTSLLNILSQRVKQTKGNLKTNGELIGKNYRSLTAYVEQDDVLLGNLTVKETLRYAALLRLPKTMNYKEKMSRVYQVMDELGLRETQNTLVGVPGLSKGISGGERKRLSIAIELLTQPSIIFLDEATSGLDAKSSMNLLELISKIAKNGKRTIVMSIHQPRSSIFQMFDKLLLMAKGHVVYFGDAHRAMDYFTKIGYPPPKNFNPADHLLDMTAFSKGIKDPNVKQQEIQRIEHFINEYESQPKASKTLLKTNQRVASSMASEEVDLSDKVIKSNDSELDDPLDVPLTDKLERNLSHYGGYGSSWWLQFIVIFWRSFINVMRDRVLTVARFIQSVIFAVLIGLIFLRLGYNQRGVQNRLGVLFFVLLNQSLNVVFPTVGVFLGSEKAVYLRERSSKTYMVSAYYLGKTLADIPVIVVFPFLFCCIVYWMVGLKPEPGAFFTFILIVISCAFCAHSLGILVAAISPNLEVANTITPILLVAIILFGGFYINAASIPMYFIWIYYASFFKYGFEALVLNEFTGMTITCDPGEYCTYKTGEDVIAFYSMTTVISNIWIDIAFIYAISIVYRILAYFIMRFWVKPKQ